MTIVTINAARLTTEIDLVTNGLIGMCAFESTREREWVSLKSQSQKIRTSDVRKRTDQFC